VKARAIEKLFARFDAVLTDRGYLAMGGQIIDASVVPAPKQRNTEEEKAAIKDGRIPDGWKDKPAKLRHKDRDARWTVKFTKARVKAGAAPKARRPVDLAIPMFGYKSHIAIDRTHGLIRTFTVTAENAHDGAQLSNLIRRDNTGSGVWADTAYRSKKNEAFLRRRLLTSHIHRKKPPNRPMPVRTAKANAKRSVVRSAVEHVFAGQKHASRRAHDRHRARHHPHRHGQPGLQFLAMRLARRESSARMRAKAPPTRRLDTARR